MKQPLQTPLNSVTPEISEWLQNFAAAVRNRDFEAGRALFDPDVVGFGTVRARAEGLEELITEQWSVVWPTTRSFTFDAESASIVTADGLAIIMINWSSIGRGEDGKELSRAGRATIGLGKSGGQWRALHTHFSINPS